MADRKAYLGKIPSHPELDKLLERARSEPVSDDQLREQRVSFAYGNAPESSGVTKDTARSAAQTIRITRK
jgi:hypothetical protein